MPRSTTPSRRTYLNKLKQFKKQQQQHVEQAARQFHGLRQTRRYRYLAQIVKSSLRPGSGRNCGRHRQRERPAGRYDCAGRPGISWRASGSCRFDGCDGNFSWSSEQYYQACENQLSADPAQEFRGGFVFGRRGGSACGLGFPCLEVRSSRRLPGSCMPQANSAARWTSRGTSLWAERTPSQQSGSSRFGFAQSGSGRLGRRCEHCRRPPTSR